MDMVPLLDISLGLFLAIFGFILERLGRSQMRDAREQGHSSWQTAAFGFMMVIGAAAALLSGLAYALLGHEPRFLIQTVVSLGLAAAGALNFRRLRQADNQPLKYSMRYLNDGLIWAAGIVMGITGAIMVVTFPARAVVSADDIITSLRTAIQVTGVIAGFSAIGFMLLNILIADS